jgi:hypothetical protein
MSLALRLYLLISQWGERSTFSSTPFLTKGPFQYTLPSEYSSSAPAIGCRSRPGHSTELASYLERHSEIWTASFGDVLRYVQERKPASIEIRKADDTSLTLSLQLALDKQIYDVPGTFEVEAPAVLNNVRVESDGQLLNAKAALPTGATIIFVCVPTRTQVVEVTKQH